MTNTDTIQTKYAADLWEGDIIVSGVLSKVTAVHKYWDEVTIFVVDVNGYRDMLRRSPNAQYAIYSEALYEEVRNS